MSSPAAPRLPEIVGKLFDILEPLEADIRQRALRSVHAMLDDEVAAVPAADPRDNGLAEAEAPAATFGRRASAWMKKYGLTDEMLAQVFHADAGKVDVVGALPGSTKREQSINAYLLAGVRALLATDEPKFADSDAVELCKRNGCYDAPNHAQTRSMFGNRITGAKNTGFMLTMPGLEQAAVIVKAAVEGH